MRPGAEKTRPLVNDPTTKTDDTALADLVRRSLDRPVAPGIDGLVAQVAGRPGVAAVLFYGNMLRDTGATGLADIYVLTDHDRVWSGTGPGAAGNRLLPPNVYHLPATETAPGAKVAVMRLAAFRHRMRRESRDTTLWARFAQPAALVHARDEAARSAVIATIATAWRTAAWWADRLSDGPDRWTGLFAQTYGAELRVESKGRPTSIIASAPEFYAEIDRLLPAGHPSAEERAAARRAWRRRQRLGRVLNVARLVKAAMTFRGGTAYMLDKIQRHAGEGALRPWERRLPWLAAPVVLFRLLRKGGLR